MALSVLSLPPELVLEVSDYLPPDGLLALKLTHPVLYNTIPLVPRPKNTTLPTCTRLAIRTYLSEPQKNPTRMRCILCKAIYPAASFKASSSPVCDTASPGTEETQVIELPQRLCAWHVGRLARIVRTGPQGKNMWVSQMGEMCIHCGAVQAWNKCDCNCDSCSFRPVKTYTRYLNNNSECKTFVFWRGRASPSEGRSDQLFVRETCRGDFDSNHGSVINLPVTEHED